ncbi:Ribosomal RNA small subunit methyltransferase I [Hyella patelloides LEGE 07179]|uniref:Ribosomal RNA small subunit methyltransferase I n=1 Tax=Hyella patelloides LEGE 07179 TaxID=945734 RepID=A0A563W4Z2_9CYAN|nr:16S rRNA (cytidine(1402)-2'-O)-methyltransferase [Hyella patelloides]VEP18736.1 Ribosomal RNA small subunit methyltransferase I [Hyella patelloides LEGE 07179]
MTQILALGTLYLVGTPIGNLQDMSLRGVRILQEVDLIAAEDTRHTGKLLHHFQITTPQISYYKHNQGYRTKELIVKLQQGINIALVSDAGMPSISDPGYLLVKEAIACSIAVIPIPGVSAGITALAVSGLITERFVFEGFVPVKGQVRSDRLKEIAQETKTMIFYEAPHRLVTTLKDLATALGETRKVVLAREITKIHEEFWRGDLASAIALYQEERKPKGEFTLIVAGAEKAPEILLSESEVKKELQQLLQQGMTRSQASRHLAKLTNLSRQEIYQLSLQ